MDQDKRDSIIKRIQGLLALSANNDNEHQAAAAAEKATELLLKYELSLDEVTRKSSEYQWKDREFENSTWKLALYSTLARANLCDVIYSRKDHQAHIVGKKHHVEVVEYFYHYLSKVVERLADEAWETYLSETPFQFYTVRTFKHSFRVGVVTALIERLEAQKEALDGETRALVVINDRALQEEVKKRFEHTASGRGGRTARGPASLGIEAGRGISLHDGVNGSNPSGYIH